MNAGTGVEISGCVISGMRVHSENSSHTQHTHIETKAFNPPLINHSGENPYHLTTKPRKHCLF